MVMRRIYLSCYIQFFFDNKGRINYEQHQQFDGQIGIASQLVSEALILKLVSHISERTQ
jgi:hypothetical protein